MRSSLILIAASALLCPVSFTQDHQDQQPAAQGEAQRPAPQPSLGDIARQLKLKKQQKEAQLKAKDAANQEAQSSEATSPAAPPKTAHLVTNDEVPERASVTPVSTRSASSGTPDSQDSAGDHQAKGENWKSQILAQKKAISELQQDIKNIGNSIHYAGGNCIANCAQWNEKQQQKQQEVDTMKAQLEEAQKQLEEMQESARKEGFGSSVYDP